MVEDIKSLGDLEAVAASSEAVVETATIREAKRDDFGRSYATGKRKDAIARVWIKPGSGKVVVNGKEMNAYFARPVLQMILRQPFQVAGVEDQFDVNATVKAKEPVARPTAPIMPPVNPPIAPIKKPNFLPNFCIKFERGEAVNIEPSTIIEIGRVAKHAFEAKDWPANPPTVKIIGICEPPVPEEVVKKLSDDLNTAGVISLLHNYANNGEIGKLKAAANFLGLLTEEMSEWFADVDMSSLEDLFIDFRNRAIESKNFKNVDELRSKLTGAGVDVQIGKSNVLIVPNARFDRQKLDEIKIYYDLN